eukprot:1150034-Pelagomonas_calceolata.AAC.8
MVEAGNTKLCHVLLICCACAQSFISCDMNCLCVNVQEVSNHVHKKWVALRKGSMDNSARASQTIEWYVSEPGALFMATSLSLPQ